MDRETMKQMRGAKDLLQDGVDAAANSIEKAQRGVVHRSYDIVARVTHLDLPVRAIESVQQAVTGGIYASIRLGNHATAAAATIALDCLEARASDDAPTDEDLLK